MSGKVATKKFDFKKFNKGIELKVIQENKELLSGIVKLIAQAPGIEWDIVDNFLQREGYVLQSGAEADRQTEKLVQRLALRKNVNKQFPNLGKAASRKARKAAGVHHVH